MWQSKFEVINNVTQQIIGEAELDLASYKENEFSTKFLQIGITGTLEVAIKGSTVTSKLESPALKKQQTSVSSSSIDSQQQEAILKLMDDIKAEKKRRSKIESDHQEVASEAKEKIHEM